MSASTVCAVFADWDTNNTGTISKSDLLYVLSTLMVGKLNQKQIDKLVACINVHSDGFINYKEFCYWICNDKCADLHNQRAEGIEPRNLTALVSEPFVREHVVKFMSLRTISSMHQLSISWHAVVSAALKSIELSLAEVSQASLLFSLACRLDLGLALRKSARADAPRQTASAPQVFPGLAVRAIARWRDILECVRTEHHGEVLLQFAKSLCSLFSVLSEIRESKLMQVDVDSIQCVCYSTKAFLFKAGQQIESLAARAGSCPIYFGLAGGGGDKFLPSQGECCQDPVLRAHAPCFEHLSEIAQESVQTAKAAMTLLIPPVVSLAGGLQAISENREQKWQELAEATGLQLPSVNEATLNSCFACGLGDLQMQAVEEWSDQAHKESAFVKEAWRTLNTFDQQSWTVNKLETAALDLVIVPEGTYQTIDSAIVRSEALLASHFRTHRLCENLTRFRDEVLSLHDFIQNLQQTQCQFKAGYYFIANCLGDSELGEALATAWTGATSSLHGPMLETFRAHGSEAIRGLTLVSDIMQRAEDKCKSFYIWQRKVAPVLSYLSDQDLQEMNVAYSKDGITGLGRYMLQIFEVVSNVSPAGDEIDRLQVIVRTRDEKELPLLQPISRGPLEEWLSQFTLELQGTIKHHLCSAQLRAPQQPLGLCILQQRIAWGERISRTLQEDGRLCSAALQQERMLLTEAMKNAREAGHDEQCALKESLRAFQLAAALAAVPARTTWNAPVMTWPQIPRLYINRADSVPRLILQCAGHEAEFGYCDACLASDKPLLNVANECAMCEAMMRSEAHGTGVILNGFKGSGGVVLAKSVASNLLGLPAIVFNTSKEMWRSPAVLEKFAAGISSSRAWAILDGLPASLGHDVEEQVIKGLRLLHNQLRGRIVVVMGMDRSDDLSQDPWALASARLPSARAELQALCGLQVCLQEEETETCLKIELALNAFEDFDTLASFAGPLLSKACSNLPGQSAVARGLASAAAACRAIGLPDAQSLSAAAALLILARQSPEGQLEDWGHELCRAANFPQLGEDWGATILPVLGRCCPCILVVTDETPAPGALRRALETPRFKELEIISLYSHADNVVGRNLAGDQRFSMQAPVDPSVTALQSAVVDALRVPFESVQIFEEGRQLGNADSIGDMNLITLNISEIISLGQTVESSENGFNDNRSYAQEEFSSSDGVERWVVCEVKKRSRQRPVELPPLSTYLREALRFLTSGQQTLPWCARLARIASHAEFTDALAALDRWSGGSTVETLAFWRLGILRISSLPEAEFSPQDLQLVMEEAGVSRQRAMEALREHDGDFDAAIDALLDSTSQRELY